MRVVYVSTLERGGPLSHLRDLAPAVAQTGADVHVVCASDEVAESFRRIGVDASAAPLRHKLDVRGALGLTHFLRGADIVHTHDRRAGLLARPQAPVLRGRAVHTLHGLPEEIAVRVGRQGTPTPPGVTRGRLAWLLHGYMRIEALLTMFGHVVAPSRALADFVVAYGLPRRRVRVIPYGIPIGAAPPPRGATDGPLALGTAANLEHWKGIDVLLAACQRLEVPYRLHVYGKGTLRAELERDAAARGVEATFHGFVPDYRERLVQLDVFVLPTRGDNLPVSILEAMAAGLPVVASRLGGIPELVVEGETGLLVEPENPGALAAALEELARDPQRRLELGRRGATRAAEEFSAEEIGRRMRAFYDELCESST